MKNTSADEINLLEYFSVLSKRKRFIGALTGGVFVLSIIGSLLLPDRFAATASVMQGAQDNSMKVSMMAALPDGLGSAAGGLFGKSSTDAWVGILESNSVRDGIIKRFGLREAYGKDTIEDTRKELGGNISVVNTKEDVVVITVEDEDPKKAAAMANAFVEELDRINRDAVMTSGKSTRLFVEKRLVETKGELTRIEDGIRAFQMANKALKLDDQSAAIIESFGDLRGRLAAKEVELQVLRSYATDSNPQVQTIRAEIGGLRRQLTDAQEGTLRDIFIPTNRIPDLSLQYARLLRDAKVQETLFELLTQQYELARIQEAKDSPTIQVLDLATVPEKKSGPKRGLMVVLATFSALTLSSVWAFVAEYLAGMKSRAL